MFRTIWVFRPLGPDLPKRSDRTCMVGSYRYTHTTWLSTDLVKTTKWDKKERTPNFILKTTTTTTTTTTTKTPKQNKPKQTKHLLISMIENTVQWLSRILLSWRSSITFALVSGCRSVAVSHSYGSQQPIKIKDRFSHFMEFSARGKPDTQCYEVWLLWSNRGHPIDNVCYQTSAVRSNFSWTTVGPR